MKDSQSLKKKQKKPKKQNRLFTSSAASSQKASTTVFEKKAAKSLKKDKKVKSPQPPLIKGGNKVGFPLKKEGNKMQPHSEKVGSKGQQPIHKGGDKDAVSLAKDNKEKTSGKEKTVEKIVVEWEKSGIPKPAPKTSESVYHKEAQWDVGLFLEKLHKSISAAMHYRPKKKTVSKYNRLFKRYETDLQLVLIPVILLFILSIVTLLNNRAKSALSAYELNNDGAIARVNPYPFVNAVAIPKLSAKAAIIADADSQVVLFSKNPDLRFSMASTTKIMTALVGLEYFTPDSILTIKADAVEGTTIGLQPGDKFNFEDLLYAMMLPSANDAAWNIAANYPGGVEAFVKKMNEKAAELHLSNTHYADPVGLDDDGDYTTVIDMARLASSAVKNSEFTTVTSTKQKVITSLGYGEQYSLNNLNKLLGIYGVTGIKTGTTEGAGEVLVTSTVSNGHTFIIVVMNSTDRFADTKTLLGFIEQSVEFIVPSKPIGEN